MSFTAHEKYFLEYEVYITTTQVVAVNKSKELISIILHPGLSHQRKYSAPLRKKAHDALKRNYSMIIGVL